MPHLKMKTAKPCEGCYLLRNESCGLCGLEVPEMRRLKFDCPLDFVNDTETPFKSKPYLFTAHIVKHKTIARIARDTEVSISTITKYLNKYKIPIRTYKNGEW